MKSLVLGNGEIGKSVTAVISASDEVIIYDSANDNVPPILRGIEIMHVCFPCKDQQRFVEAVNHYKAKYNPSYTIIWSTVPIGTTKMIRNAVHSPVEGRHPALEESIRSMRRWIGVNDTNSAQFFSKYFSDLYLHPRVVDNSNFTEFLKLRSTSKFGINLAWTEYEASVAKELDMPFRLVKDFDTDYNDLYDSINMPWAKRYILDPPEGHIGGHCIVPNAGLLDEQFPSDMLKMIKELK